MTTKLSRERKVFIGILGVALIGLGADRMFFSSGLTGPAEASAAVGEFEVDASLEAPLGEVDPEPVAIHESTESATEALAGRFKEYAQRGSSDITGLSNVFNPSDSWLGGSDLPAGADRAASATDEFGATHRLNAVMMSRSNPGAVVNKRLIAVGQEVDGFTLIEVNERSVVFEGEDERVVLELDPPADPS
ncbi:MAG: hypothetical protein JSV91_11005 [Phycisphaerales bacterium]|nr:MAG: hypothetical protein JSV91_11005 [Phycisphaerales bacterium]